MFFLEKPEIDWLKLLRTHRDKLKTKSTIPKIEAEWKYAEHSNLEAYQECFGFPAAHIPLSYPQVLATPLHLQLLSHPSFPFPVLGIVHTHQKMRLFREMTPQPFHIKSWIEGHRIVRSGAEFTIHTQVYQNNDLAWEAEMLILSRAVKGHGKKEDKPDAFIQNPSLYEKWYFPSNLGRQYAKISGDYNPIHLHYLTAKLFGMPRHIIHGMYCVGKILSSLPQNTTEMNISFLRPIFLPSSVEFLANDKQFLLRNPRNGTTHISGDV